MLLCFGMRSFDPNAQSGSLERRRAQYGSLNVTAYGAYAVTGIVLRIMDAF